MKNMETLMKIHEVAKVLTVSPRTVQNWVYEGLLPHLKIGGAVRFKLSDIQRIQQKGLPRRSTH